eukprot:TRINITY_DN15738_c0_g1_i1.p1 TRINITY_DN15738_c0_g1~~TRINITY_DN15738_c0_g1_i1.p1  ORF type:complete len:464 (-),score=100.20 TRINITY_DN15738_c0_g1_i1:47-1438(-)
MKRVTQQEAAESKKSRTDQPLQYLQQHGDQVLQAISHDHPFHHVICRDFLDEDFLSKVKAELLEEEYIEKDSDLFSFQQSNDLKGSTQAGISALRSLLYSPEFLGVMSKVTGIALNNTVDMASIRFTQTGNLLCHDDDLAGRRIAYIIYLVPKDWSEADGGSLDLFSVDGNGEPAGVVKKLVPAWNTFTFFEVSPVSFHQVAEIVSADKERLSISGWFHGEPFARPAPHEEPAIAFEPLAEEESSLLREWISPQYLKPAIQRQINSSFVTTSSIELPAFLQEDKFEELLKVLADEPWQHQGPAHKRSYEKVLCDAATSTDIVVEARRIFSSKPFAKLLQALTGLDLETVAGEVRRFQVGHYTLLQDTKREPHTLDVVFNLSPVWEETWGGALVYVAERGEEALLSGYPDSNTLSIVYREPGTLRFVKLVNCLAHIARYDFSFMYRESEAALAAAAAAPSDEDE